MKACADSLQSMLSGAAGAGLVVAGYFAATVVGLCLGAWSTGWDVYGPEPCVMEFFSNVLGLKKLAGLMSFVGLGMVTLVYFKFDRLKWECLNALALLADIYVYVGCGAGNAPHSQTIILQVPAWRFPASVVGILVAYAVGRAALLVAGHDSFGSARR